MNGTSNSKCYPKIVENKDQIRAIYVRRSKHRLPLWIAQIWFCALNPLSTPAVCLPALSFFLCWHHKLFKHMLREEEETKLFSFSPICRRFRTGPWRLQLTIFSLHSETHVFSASRQDTAGRCHSVTRAVSSKLKIDGCGCVYGSDVNLDPVRPTSHRIC